MGKWRLTTTEADIEAALEDARNSPPEPEAVSAEYVGGNADVVVIRLDTGLRLAIPRENLQGLQDATETQLAEIEIHGGWTSRGRSWTWTTTCPRCWSTDTAARSGWKRCGSAGSRRRESRCSLLTERSSRLMLLFAI